MKAAPDTDLDETLPRGIATGDFNGDGKPDLAVAETSSFTRLTTTGLTTYLGNGDGTFQPPVANETLVGLFLATGDFNGDGKLDLALSNLSAPPSLSIELGNGDGTFTTAGTVTGPCGPISAADLRADGKQDVVVADSALNQVAVLLGNGDGTLQAPVNYATGTDPMAVTFGDFNGDGKLDLAVADAGAGSVSILLGNGDGTFQPHVDYATGNSPSSIVAGDFNNDGRIDLAVTNTADQTVSVLLGNGDGTFQMHVDYPVPNAVGLAAADFNGDGKLDFAVGGPSFSKFGTIPVAGVVSILFGNGDGTFQAHTDYTVAGTVNSLLSPDFNSDGAPDLAVLTFNNTQVPADAVLSALLNTPVVALFPFSLTFADTALGSTSTNQTVTISNPGVGKLSIPSVSATGDFAATNNCPSSLAAGANCTVTITFTPTVAGTRTGALTITDNSPSSPQTIALTGIGGAEIGFSPANLTFSDQLTGTTSLPQSITLTNTGSVALGITSITASGDFTETNNCGASLAAAASCAITVTFAPTAAGSIAGSVTIADNAGGSPQTVALTGTGVAPAPVVSLSPLSLTFGGQLVGTGSPEQTVTLTNTGNAALSITGVTASGDFIANSLLCRSPIAVNGSCSILVFFKPSATGTRTGTLSIADNAPGSPQTASLTGTGTAPAVSLSATELLIGGVVVGATGSFPALTVTNTGTGTLSISSVKIGGANGSDFTDTDNCPSSLPVFGSCSISVSFKPTAGGNRVGTLTLTDNAPGGSQTVELSGVGSDFSLSVVGSSSATVQAGQTATYAIGPSGVGGIEGNVSFACTGAPSEATCAVSPTSVSFPPVGIVQGAHSTPPQVTVTVTTTAPSLAPPLGQPRWPLPPLGALRPHALWLALLTLLLLAVLATPRRRRALLALGAVMLVITVWASCGGGASASTNPGTPAGTYSLTVTGTFTQGSVTLSHAANLTLVVQ